MSTTTPNIDNLAGSIPVDVLIHDGSPVVEWLEMPNAEFKEPFFTQTVNKFRTLCPQATSIFTDFSVLLDVERKIDILQPSGLIFHSSRCGSTLVANAFRKVEGSIVMSEPPPLDKLITRLLTDIDASRAKELLYLTFVRATASALGRPRSSFERHYFIKFAATSTLQIRRLRSIWPKVPMLFVYRSPVETIVSNLANVPEWMQRSNQHARAKAIGVSTDELAEMDSVEYCARALGQFYDSVPLDDANLLICNYDDLSADKLVEIVKFFGVNTSTDEDTAICNSIEFYSKDRAKPFLADTNSKRASASEKIMTAAEKWAMPAYNKLVTRATVATSH